jgi:hypothetical protein
MENDTAFALPWSATTAGPPATRTGSSVFAPKNLEHYRSAALLGRQFDGRQARFQNRSSAATAKMAEQRQWA